MKPAISLIGPGKVGCAISRRLYLAGYPFSAVISRQQQRAVEACHFIGCPTELATANLASAASARIILLAVPDDQIKPQVTELNKKCNLSPATTLIHFSGLHPAAEMASPNGQAKLLSLHPLLPFAERESAYNQLSGCPCAIEGDQQALLLGEELVTAIGGQAFEVKIGTKGLYHTAACIASNYFVTLVASATELLSGCGISQKQSIQLLQPLLQATLKNMKQLGPEQGLTGPIVRGDTKTIASHLQLLEEDNPELLHLYKLLGEKTLELAQSSGRLAEKPAAKITKTLRSGS